MTYMPMDHPIEELKESLAKGKELTASFTLNGQKFMALNGGGDVEGYEAKKFNEAMSVVVECDTQEEIDHLYDALSAVPEAEVRSPLCLPSVC
jgi:predicted 3-demethylubiquinone-9 3-methyltransferase (glyoxalase superfamily)